MSRSYTILSETTVHKFVGPFGLPSRPNIHWLGPAWDHLPKIGGLIDAHRFRRLVDKLLAQDSTKRQYTDSCTMIQYTRIPKRYPVFLLPTRYPKLVDCHCSADGSVSFEKWKKEKTAKDSTLFRCVWSRRSGSGERSSGRGKRPCHRFSIRHLSEVAWQSPVVYICVSACSSVKKLGTQLKNGFAVFEHDQPAFGTEIDQTSQCSAAFATQLSRNALTVTTCTRHLQDLQSLGKSYAHYHFQ